MSKRYSVDDIYKMPQNTQDVIQSIIKNNDYQVLQEAIIKLAKDEQKLVYTRNPLLQTLIGQLENIPDSQMRKFGEFIVANLPNQNFFEYELYKIKSRMADVYHSIEQFYLAAKILSEINYESSNLQLKEHELIEKYLTIVVYYYQFDESSLAEQYLQKASMHDLTTLAPEWKFQYDFCISCNQDYQRKFLPAAVNYFILSQNLDIDNNETLNCLNNSVKCAILGAAGPQRSRILANLYKDKRIKDVQTYEIFKQMYFDRIISKEEKDSFQKSLKPHQRAIVDDNYSVVDLAIMEHNIIAASKVYETISFESLSSILQVNKLKTQQLLEKMIEENRLKAQLDQMTEYVQFLGEDQIPINFNERISSFCGKINDFLEKVQKQQ